MILTPTGSLMAQSAIKSLNAEDISSVNSSWHRSNQKQTPLARNVQQEARQLAGTSGPGMQPTIL